MAIVDTADSTAASAYSDNFCHGAFGNQITSPGCRKKSGALPPKIALRITDVTFGAGVVAPRITKIPDRNVLTANEAGTGQ